MPYLKVIETTQTWVCPKTGFYKIICVAGGSGGNCSSGANYDWFRGTPGGVTSFGSKLTSSGVGFGGGVSGSYGSFLYGGGGGGGYTFSEYGGNGASPANGVNACSKNGGMATRYSTANLAVFKTTPHSLGNGAGYGGGGGGCSGGGGVSGSLIASIFSLTEGESIPCTIGAGGAGATGTDTANTAITVYGAKGNNGAIIIQEV